MSQRRNVATLIIRYLLSLLRSEVWEVHSYYIVSVKWKLGSRFIPFCERRRSHKKEAPFCGIGGWRVSQKGRPFLFVFVCAKEANFRTKTRITFSFLFLCNAKEWPELHNYATQCVV